MNKTFFIAGTDTEVGKTFVTVALLRAAARAGKTTAAIKPVAAGCERTDAGLRNDDALRLQEAMSIAMPYEQVNPVAFEPPIAPHIAAARAQKMLTANHLAGFCRGVQMKRADITLIEGAGGWRVPLNPVETLAELPKQLNTPVILVVGMRLGCINHALLTAEAIQRDGLPLAGWVANRVDPTMECYEDNLQTLQGLIHAPLLGDIPRLNADSDPTPFINLEPLF